MSGKSQRCYRTGKQGGQRVAGKQSGLCSQEQTQGTARQSLKTPPNRAVLKLHSGLRKAESSVPVQARTGRIGLAKFLYSRKVPGILSAQCRCRAGEETPRHMALFCTDETERRQCLRAGRRVNYRERGSDSGVAVKLSPS